MPPLVVRERLVSDLHRRESTSEVNRERVFDVFDSTGAPITVSDALGAPDLPQLGDPHPLLPTLVATRNQATRREGHTDLVEVTWEYEVAAGPGGENEPGAVGHVSFDVQIRAEFRDVFRAPPFAAGMSPTALQGNVSGNLLTTDIGGVHMDIQGVPLSFLATKQSLVITETREGAPAYSTIIAQAGTRNLLPFYGAPPGFVVFVGAHSTETEAGIYRVVYEFEGDNFYHMHQFVQRDQQREPVLSQGTAVEVFWRQPFGGLSDFDSLSPYF
jgi:hypothetical protein